MLLRRDAHEARLEMYTVLACLSKTCPKQASREPRFYHFPVTREAPTTDITTDQTRVRPRRCELAIHLIYKCYILGLLLPPITFKISLLLSAPGTLSVAMDIDTSSVDDGEEITQLFLTFLNTYSSGSFDVDRAKYGDLPSRDYVEQLSDMCDRSGTTLYVDFRHLVR